MSVRLAASGEMIVITDRDRIVAEIVPPQRNTDAFFGRGYVRGGFRLRQIRPANRRRTILVPFEELMQELERDREDR
jgi:antitoxin (DNA-binding transcriptional repressor) of toxin-antitoxin stability system